MLCYLAYPPELIQRLQLILMHACMHQLLMGGPQLLLQPLLLQQRQPVLADQRLYQPKQLVWRRRLASCACCAGCAAASAPHLRHVSDEQLLQRRELLVCCI